jgi:hypothetical protein
MPLMHSDAELEQGAHARPRSVLYPGLVRSSVMSWDCRVGACHGSFVLELELDVTDYLEEGKVCIIVFVMVISQMESEN